MNKQSKTRAALLAAAAAAVLLVAALIAISTSGGSEDGVLNRFYAAMYTQEGGGIDSVVACLAPGLQEDYYNTITSGGTTFQQLSAWRVEAMSMVGDNAKTRVRVLQRGDDEASQLQQLRQTYPDASRYHTVAFELTLTGDQAEERFVGVLPMALIDGDWYLLSTSADLRRVVDETQQEAEQ